jgi:hypothetical protein
MVVFRCEQVRGRSEIVMRVVEFLATPPAQRALTRSLLEAARAAGVTYADFYCSSAAAARGLEEAGFHLESMGDDQPVFPTRLQPLEHGRFSLRALLRLPSAMRGRLNALVDAGRLYVTKADGDQDRPN